ncbi:hypothetical protein [Streptomyces niveiscabiei]|uniref:Secreted protein n=1 Tax=Streptomyces niveiscabiei TaxID=164115 RepID=A0ABW9I817_9ACTN
MKTAVRVCFAASAVGNPATKTNEPIRTVDINGVEVDENASAETRQIIGADASAAIAAANVCGTGYTISTGAWRYSTYGTTYAWTNGTSGSGSTRYIGVRLRSNYTADAPDEDFGSYAGPVHQKRGYCGTVYSYMRDSAGKALVDRVQTVGSCG